jgi:hypothetical protein
VDEDKEEVEQNSFENQLYNLFITVFQAHIKQLVNFHEKKQMIVKDIESFEDLFKYYSDSDILNDDFILGEIFGFYTKSISVLFQFATTLKDLEDFCTIFLKRVATANGTISSKTVNDQSIITTTKTDDFKLFMSMIKDVCNDTDISVFKDKYRKAITSMIQSHNQEKDSDIHNLINSISPNKTPDQNLIKSLLSGEQNNDESIKSNTPLGKEDIKSADDIINKLFPQLNTNQSSSDKGIVHIDNNKKISFSDPDKDGWRKMKFD